jgi:hypothetical protein
MLDVTLPIGRYNSRRIFLTYSMQKRRSQSLPSCFKECLSPCDNTQKASLNLCESNRSSPGQLRRLLTGVSARQTLSLKELLRPTSNARVRAMPPGACQTSLLTHSVQPWLQAWLCCSGHCSGK